MVHRFVVAGYVTSYVVFSTAVGFASLLKSCITYPSLCLYQSRWMIRSSMGMLLHGEYVT